jgi:hypothetical protein
VRARSESLANGATVKRASWGRYWKQPPQCVAAPSGLVSWWPGNGNANDIIGANHGTLLNGVDYTSGMVSQAFNTDGNSQCVRIPYSPTLTTTQYSVEAWIKPSAQVNDPIGQEFIFGQGYGTVQLVVRTGTSGVRVALNFGTSHDEFYDVESTIELPIGQFSHVVGTWDGTTMSLYINGAWNNSRAPGVVPVDSGCPFYIGGIDAPDEGDCSFVGQFFNGAIDELSYYGRALSLGEVQGLYQAGSAGKCH